MSSFLFDFYTVAFDCFKIIAAFDPLGSRA